MFESVKARWPSTTSRFLAERVSDFAFAAASPAVAFRFEVVLRPEALHPQQQL